MNSSTQSLQLKTKTGTIRLRKPIILSQMFLKISFFLIPLAVFFTFTATMLSDTCRTPHKQTPDVSSGHFYPLLENHTDHKDIELPCALPKYELSSYYWQLIFNHIDHIKWDLLMCVYKPYIQVSSILVYSHGSFGFVMNK